LHKELSKVEQSTGRRSRRLLQQEMRATEEQGQEFKEIPPLQPAKEEPKQELEHGVHHLPYPSGEGHMIIRNGFPNA
jgi:hypothetical protein